MNAIAVILVGAVLAVVFETGTALQCFECISGDGQDGDACADPFDAQVAIRKNLLKNCDSLTRDNGELETRNYTMCRKFLQDVEGDYRVVRGCATSGRPGKCIDRTGTAKIKLQYCECENDNPDKPCNHATSAVGSEIVLGVSVLTILSAIMLQ